jgi:predicted transcriptional regulator
MIEKGQKRAPRKGGLYTPLPKQNHVIAASLAGKNKSEISREVGIKRDTVARILSQPEVQELLAEYRQQARGLVPHCLAGLEAKLITKAGKLRKSIDWRMMVEVLKGTQVFIGKQEQEVHEKKDEFDGRSRKELKFYLENGRFPDADSSEQVSGKETPDGTGASRTLPN